MAAEGEKATDWMENLAWGCALSMAEEIANMMTTVIKPPTKGERKAANSLKLVMPAGIVSIGRDHHSRRRLKVVEDGGAVGYP